MRRCTIKVEFAEKPVKASDFEVLRFALFLGITPTELFGFQQHSNDECLYYKLKPGCDEKVHKIVNKNRECVFEHANGAFCKVKVSVAKKVFEYIRVFDIPFEVDDQLVFEAFAPYGEVRNIVWEKSANFFNFDAFNGVRGVYIYLKKDLPSCLYVQGNKCKIFYNGLKDGWFSCGSAKHTKQNCQKCDERSMTHGSSTDFYQLAWLSTADSLDSADENSRKLKSFDSVSEHDFSFSIFLKPVHNNANSSVNNVESAAQLYSIDRHGSLDSSSIVDLADTETRFVAEKQSDSTDQAKGSSDVSQVSEELVAK
jgi:hypothetical protein